MTSRLDNARLAVLVHEIRSPVAALSAVAETVAEPDSDASTRHELARLAVAACRAVERLVLDVAVASVHLEPLDVVVLARDAVAAHVVRGSDVLVEAETSALLVDGDPVRLRQALDNLIANALVHGGGGVTVRVTGSDDVVGIAVSDAGPGISGNDQDVIFELGARLSADTPGSGLGLALARLLVEAHGGTITVDSAPGSGSTFTIALPARSRQPDTRASSS